MERCYKTIWANFHRHQCTRKIWKDDKCKQHHPESVQERNDKRNQKYEEDRKKTPPFRLEKLRDGLVVLINDIEGHSPAIAERLKELMK